MAGPRKPEPPKSPRVFYGSELRRLREAAGFSQDKLGELVFCSGAYIGQIEAATRRPQLDLSERFDAALKTDGYFARLYPMASSSPFPEHPTPIAELQARAITIHTFEPMLVPGVLQTRKYAEAIFRSAQPFRPAEELAELVDFRVGRGRLLEHPTRPLFWAVLDEVVLRRPVGGREAMREQLHHVVDLILRNRIIVQILPFVQGAHALLEGAIMLMTFADAPPAAFIEAPHVAQLVDDPELFAKCALSYDLARAAALSPEASLALIQSALKEYADEE